MGESLSGNTAKTNEANIRHYHPTLSHTAVITDGDATLVLALMVDVV